MLTINKPLTLRVLGTEINPNTREGFLLVLEHAKDLRKSADFKRELVHALDPSTKYGYKSASFAIENILDINEIRELVKSINPNTTRGQNLIHSVALQGKLDCSTADLIVEKIKVSNIHGSKCIKFLSAANLLSDSAKKTLRKKIHFEGRSICTDLRIVRISEMRLGISNGHSVNSISLGGLRYAQERRHGLGKAPAPTPPTRRVSIGS